VSAATDTEQPVAGRSTRKRQAIMHAARDLFLRKGYAGTSMDEVALMAEASKVTIYKHFSDKQTLFIAVVTDAIDETKAGSQSLVDQLGNSTDLELDLREFARQHAALVTQPHLIQMRRMIIAEAHRFPDLARAWHRVGPERAHTTLAGQIDKLVARGQLQVPDSLVAAQLLNYLILSVPLNEAMFTGRDKPYGRRYLNRYADEAVRVFLAAYRPARKGRYTR
jgi:TetR/AcrR family transcriptional regulator, mexJK operon transcriptional repressor